MKSRHAPHAFGCRFPLWLLAVLFLGFLLAGTACVWWMVASAPSQMTFAIGFSPTGESLNIIQKAINDSEHSILVAACWFTSEPVAAALVKAHERGVKVRVVADADANAKTSKSKLTFLANHDVGVRINKRYELLHHKFMVIDERHVQTGSFNYTKRAVDRNAENVLLLRNVPELAEIYAQEWKKLWEEGQAIPVVSHTDGGNEGK